MGIHQHNPLHKQTQIKRSFHYMLRKYLTKSNTLSKTDKSLGKVSNPMPITKHSKSNTQKTSSQHQTTWGET